MVAAVSASAGRESSTSGGVITSPCSTRAIAAHPRHGEIEQHEIDVAAAAFEKIADLFEGARLGHRGAAEQAEHRFAQGAAKQRMVVGDQEMVRGLVVQGAARYRVLHVIAVR